MTGKTKTGFKYEIDDRVLNDWRFVNALARAQGGVDNDDKMDQLRGSLEMVNLMFGKEGEAKLMEHIAKTNDGYVPTEAVMNEIKDIFESKQVKNSHSSQSV